MSKKLFCFPGRSAEFATGWPTLAACFLVNAFSVQSLPVYTAGLFVAPLQAEFGWSRGAISAAVFALTLGTAAGAPLVGIAAGWLGEASVIAIGVCVVASGFAALGLTNGFLPAFWATFALVAAFGAGASPIPVSRLIAAAFDRSRGLALGVALVGSGAAATLAPPLAGAAIARWGWRGGYASLAVAELAVLPVILLLLRMGRKSPVTAPAAPPIDASAPAQQVGVMRRLFAAFVAIALGVGGPVVHFAPLMIDAGSAPLAAARMAAWLGVFLIFGRLSVGALLDRGFAPHIGAWVMGLGAASFVFVASAPAWRLLVAPAVGLTLGSEMDLLAYLASRYFPKRQLSWRFGVLWSGFLCAVGASPVVYGRVYDLAGSYRPAFLFSAICLGLGAWLLGRLPEFPPQHAFARNVPSRA